MAVLIPALMMILAMFIALTITRRVNIVVPMIVHEVDPPPAGMVLVAVFAPMLGMPWRYAQIERLLDYGRSLHENRTRVDHARFGEIAKVDDAVEIRLADMNGNTDISQRWDSRTRQQQRH
jgi:hypothetical protein